MSVSCPLCCLPVTSDSTRCPQCGVEQHAACLASGCVVPGCGPARAPVLPAAGSRGDAERGSFGRAVDSVAETIRIALPLAPLIVGFALLYLVPQQLMMGGWWSLASYVNTGLGLLSSAVLLPAAVLLILEPGWGGYPHLMRRVVATWPRWIPAAIIFGVCVAGPLQLGFSLFFFRTVQLLFLPVAVLVMLAVVSALALSLVIACVSREREPGFPTMRSVELAARNKLAVVIASVLCIAGPSVVSWIMLWILVSSGLSMHAGSWAWRLSTHLVFELIQHIWPVAYAALLYEDLTAARR